jgi:hypothetical protein
MIYLYRTLWLLGYIIVSILEAIVFLIGIPMAILGLSIAYIVTGTIETTPEWLIPGELPRMIDDLYRQIEP